jgi:hypothetical protein
VSVGKALSIGFTTAFVLFVGAILAVFITGSDLSFLGVGADTVATGRTRRTEIQFDVLVPIIFGLVLSGIVWLAGAVRTRRGRLTN